MNIYESISAVMRDCGAVTKDKWNSQQGYKFRGIDAVLNALSPAFTKNKIFVVPEVLDQTREERTTAKGGLLIYSVVRVKYTFYAEDGSFVSAVVCGEGMDSGDKATNKAMSAAFKYACFQTFCIPTEEMKDSEDDSPEPEPKKESPKDKTEALAKKCLNDAREAIGDQTIRKEKAEALAKKCLDEGISIPKLLEAYKAESIASLNERQHAQIIKYWEKVKANCGSTGTP